MQFFSALKTKLTTKLMGELLTEIGTAPANEYTRTLTITIRQRPAKPPHLHLKFTETGNSEHLELPCSRELADLLEKTAHEIRKQLTSRPV